MKNSTRRDFLVMAGAGAAAAGVAVVLPATAAAQPSKPVSVGAPMVAYVHDVATGELSVMVGDREVIVHDRELVNRLARLAS